jgi:glycerol-3-phosphate dehydrogenase
MLLVRIGMLAYDLLSVDKPLPRHRMLSRAELLESEPGLNADGLRGGAQYFDAQVTFPERLVLENVIDAANAGAVVKNYSPVTGIEIHQGRVRSVGYTDFATGRHSEANARVVVNAAGPWVDRVLDTANARMRPLIGPTKGSHIVVGMFEGAPQGAFYVEAFVDARPFFIMRWNGQYLIGTTDLRYAGDPAEAKASAEEIEYLLSETNRVFPRAALDKADIHFAYAGVRPLPGSRKGPESAITRRHIIKSHKNARGLLSVIGGKLTTYRSLAEQVTDKTIGLLARPGIPCRTRETLLPGATGLAAADMQVREAGSLSPEGRERLLAVYGGRARGVLELARERSDLADTLDRERTVLAAEVVFAIRHEFARTLVDIAHRRTMIGLSPGQGAAAAEELARIAAAELRWDGAETGRQLQALRDYNARLRESG